MKNLLLISSVLFLVGCGNDILITDNGNADPKSEGTSEEETKEVLEEIVEKDPILNLYELEHESGLTDDFISPDYCSGVSYRECRIKSVLLKEYESGFKISIEWQDTFTDDEYFITKGKVEEEAAFRLSDDVKLSTDDSASSRSLWVIVALEDMTMEVLYDKVGSGPNSQGVDSLDKFDFILSDKD